ncbi:MAG: DUF1492 domain-containing protein [Clostridia bacterium]|nr:DUF1492 domain-containing protein [Clostridia bacterium]
MTFSFLSTPEGQRIINYLRDFYALLDEIFNLNYSTVFNYVYVERSTLPRWILAIKCNLSESTFFRYCKNIEATIKFCYEQKLFASANLEK